MPTQMILRLKIKKLLNGHSINGITGHSQAKESLSIRTYSDGPFLETANKWLKRLDYGLDFSKIRPNGWKKCLTGKR